ncbi:hypothetical protein BJ170DRAFT_694450 [Xylariales sp. AK1849]|nr:hypothetical protein BJ170DRAFT_694450 [Xylariales sp. AK1849]
MNQPPQGQPATGQAPMRIPMYRPEQMRSLEILSEGDKEKYEKGLRGLWDAVEKNSPDTSAHIQAKQKIQEFSRMVYGKVANMRRAQQQGGQPGQQGVAPNAAAMAAQRANMAQRAGGASANAANSAASGGGAAPAQGQQRPPGPPQGAAQQVSPAIIQHVATYNIVPPPNILAEGPEKAQSWKMDMKRKYTQALSLMEATRNRMAQIEAMIKDREEKGNPMQADEVKRLQDQMSADKKSHAHYAGWVSDFRKSQQTLQSRAAQNPGARPNAAQQARPQQPPNAGNPMQAATASVNAAMDAAKNLQSGAANRQPGAPQTPTTQGAPGATATVQTTAPSSQPHPASAPQPQVKIEPGTHHPPPVNTALAAASAASGHMQSAGTPTQNSARVQTPQTAATPTTAGPPGAARPLSHQAALSLANRQNSTNSIALANQTNGANATTTPGSGGLMSNAPQSAQSAHTHGHPQAASALQATKMSIPKNLPDKAIAIPIGVAMGGGVQPGRPTMSGGTGINGGSMNQPAITKTPAYTFETEGEHVLNKRKLDELVRQVCGGGPPGQDGNYLTPDVEESVNQVADHFVDNVLNMAARLAKERGSKVLEIRDIQLVLERVYNIRIPGFTSDELRTEDHPGPGRVAGRGVSKGKGVKNAQAADKSHGIAFARPLDPAARARARDAQARAGLSDWGDLKRGVHSPLVAQAVGGLNSGLGVKNSGAKARPRGSTTAPSASPYATLPRPPSAGSHSNSLSRGAGTLFRGPLASEDRLSMNSGGFKRKRDLDLELEVESEEE